MFLFGLGNTPLKILLTSTLMEIVDKEQFGRAMALWTGISSLLQVGLSFALGAALDRVQREPRLPGPGRRDGRRPGGPGRAAAADAARVGPQLFRGAAAHLTERRKAD